jgi:hypothetical protein
LSIFFVVYDRFYRAAQYTLFVLVDIFDGQLGVYSGIRRKWTEPLGLDNQS